MPFVTEDHRISPDVKIPGDLCYIHYRKMADRWKAEPRWTTAHNIYKEMRQTLHDETKIYTHDARAAYELAWQVFFIKYVMPYEDKKEAENGTI